MSYSVGENVLAAMLTEQERILNEIGKLPVEREKEGVCYADYYKDVVSKTDILEECDRIMLIRIIDGKALVVEFARDLKVIDVIPYLNLADKMFKRCSKPRIIAL